MHVIYDVSHNIAKVEQHVVDGKERTLLVHRKGSTRAFPPHHPLIAVDYQVSLAVGEGNQVRILDESDSFRVLNRSECSEFFIRANGTGNLVGWQHFACLLDLWDIDLPLLLHSYNSWKILENFISRAGCSDLSVCWTQVF